MNEKFGARRGCERYKNGGCCVDTYRIYDSCIGQECLRNLRFCTTDTYQEILNNASALRIRDISVLWVRILTEEVPFRTGYYNITARYYFRITLEVCQGLGAIPQIISGLACYDKNVILYGGEGNVSVFYSDNQQGFCNAAPAFEQIIGGNKVPRVVVEVATPVGLDINLVDLNSEENAPCCQNLPDEIAAQFEGSFSGEFNITQTAFITIGIFTIIRLERPAQLSLDGCSNCFPDKTCESTDVFTDACTLFNSMEFPYNDFAPSPQGNNEDQQDVHLPDCPCTQVNRE